MRWFGNRKQPTGSVPEENDHELQHTTTVAGSGMPGTEEFLEVAKQTGLAQKRVREIIDEVREGCEPTVIS